MNPDAPALGIWQLIPSPMVSRLLARMGFDWVILDLQHGSIGTETAYECIHALRDGDAHPLVRVGIGNPFEVERALDLGARGVIVPMIRSAAEAQAMARAAKYPPRGGRSVGGDYPHHVGPEYVDRANDHTILLVQIEHIDAVRQIDEILAIDGVDGVFLGPTDLALSMGLPHRGYAENPEHREAIARTLECGRAAGKLVGINAYSPEDARERLVAGFHCVTYQYDVDLLMGAGRDLLARLRPRPSPSDAPPPPAVPDRDLSQGRPSPRRNTGWR